ncbi:MAG TPA: hypothetical protein VH833_05080 [Gemmatimonadales bacterium]
MTRAELLAWFESRRPVPPPTLRGHLARQAEDLSATLPEHLAAQGCALLQRVLDRPDGARELALDLLVADALVTYAFEAQSEVDTHGLVALAQRIAGGGA